MQKAWHREYHPQRLGGWDSHAGGPPIDRTSPICWPLHDGHAALCSSYALGAGTKLAEETGHPLLACSARSSLASGPPRLFASAAVPNRRLCVDINSAGDQRPAVAVGESFFIHEDRIMGSGALTRLRRWDSALLSLLVFAVVLAVYLLSMPKTVVLEDDGYFIMAAWLNGVAHPPGYPLFTAMAHAFTALPWGSVAARVHAASAFFGALTCLLVFLIARRLSGSRAASLLGALALSVSGVFWSQAIVAEVYTLNTAFFALFFWLCLLFSGEGVSGSSTVSPASATRPERIAGTMDRLRFVPPTSSSATGSPALNEPGGLVGSGWLLAAIALLYGLSLANHWPLMILSTPALLVLLASRWRQVLRSLHWLLGLVVLGLTPYLWMYVNSHDPAGFAFVGSIDGWKELLAYVLRERYAHIDHQSAATWADKLAYVVLALRSIPEQFGWPAAVLGLLGALTQRRYLRWPLIWAILLGILGNTVILALLLGFEDDPLYHSVFRVYPMVAYLLASLWIALGFRWLQDAVRPLALGISVKRVALLGAGLIACVGVVAGDARDNLRDGDRWAYDYGAAILDTLPPNAVLFVSADTDAGPVGYLHLIEGRRPDVTLYHTDGGLFANRLFHPLRTTEEEKLAAIQAFLDATERPVFFSADVPSEHGVDSYWLYRRVRPDMPKGDVFYVWLGKTPLMDYLERMLRAPLPSDGWEAGLQERMIAAAVPMLAGRVFGAKHPPSRRDTGNLGLALHYLPAKLKMAAWLLAQEDASLWAMALKYLDAAVAQRAEAQTKEDESAIYLLRGAYFAKHDAPEKAKTAYLRSMEIWPDVENQAYPAYRALMDGARG